MASDWPSLAATNTGWRQFSFRPRPGEIRRFISRHQKCQVFHPSWYYRFIHSSLTFTQSLRLVACRYKCISCCGENYTVCSKFCHFPNRKTVNRNWIAFVTDRGSHHQRSVLLTIFNVGKSWFFGMDDKLSISCRLRLSFRSVPIFLCDYCVTPVPIGLGIGFGTALGLGLKDRTWD